MFNSTAKPFHFWKIIKYNLSSSWYIVLRIPKSKFQFSEFSVQSSLIYKFDVVVVFPKKNLKIGNSWNPLVSSTLFLSYFVFYVSNNNITNFEFLKFRFQNCRTPFIFWLSCDFWWHWFDFIATLEWIFDISTPELSTPRFFNPELVNTE